MGKPRTLLSENKRSTIDFTELNKFVRTMTKEYIKKQNTKLAQHILENNKGMRSFKRGLVPQKEIIKLKNENG